MELDDDMLYQNHLIQKQYLSYILLGLIGILIGLGIAFYSIYGFFIFAVLAFLTLLMPRFNLRYFILAILASFIIVLFTDPGRLMISEYKRSVIIVSVNNIIANFSLLEFILLPIAGVIILLYFFNRRKIKTEVRRYTYWLFVFWLLLLFIISLGFLHARNPLAVTKELLKWAEIGIISIAVFIYVDQKQKLKEIYWFLFMIYLFFFLSIFGANILAGDSLARIYGPVHLSIILLLPFIDKRWAKILMFLLIPLLVLTYSRIAWITLLIVLTIFLLLTRTEKRWLNRIAIISFIFFMIGISLVLINPSFRSILVSRTLYTFSEFDQSQTDRISFYKAGLLAFMENPIKGIGAGNFRDYLLAAKPNVGFWLSFEALPRNPHATLLEFLAELGILGFVVSISIVFLLWKVLLIGKKHIILLGDRNLIRYALGIYLHFIPFIILLFLSYIGMRYRLMWGIYFGLALSLLRITHKSLQRT